MRVKVMGKLMDGISGKEAAMHEPDMANRVPAETHRLCKKLNISSGCVRFTVLAYLKSHFDFCKLPDIADQICISCIVIFERARIH